MSHLNDFVTNFQSNILQSLTLLPDFRLIAQFLAHRHRYPTVYSGVPNKRAARLFLFDTIFHPTRPY